MCKYLVTPENFAKYPQKGKQPSPRQVVAEDPRIQEYYLKS